PTQVMFCTLNTHKVDMEKLLGGQIGLEDFIFAHTKGQRKEVEVFKSEEALGLTITDNGAGYAFIKRIREGSVIDRIPVISVGDMIEAIDGRSLVGARHYEVAKMLKELPRGRTFALQLTEPRKAFGGSQLGALGAYWEDWGCGGVSMGCPHPGHPSTPESRWGCLGVQDFSVLSIMVVLWDTGSTGSPTTATMVELGRDARDPDALAQALDSQLGDFAFPDEFVFDVWGAIGDAKVGR
ncbi:GIPC1 protein, partial [Eurystomus gularis]|nr:GIPC1 protein [Eurystomus gularis]